MKRKEEKKSENENDERKKEGVEKVNMEGKERKSEVNEREKKIALQENRDLKPPLPPPH